MSHIPEGHQGTSIHHISVVKGSTQGEFPKLFLREGILLVHVSFYRSIPLRDPQSRIYVQRSISYSYQWTLWT